MNRPTASLRRLVVLAAALLAFAPATAVVPVTPQLQTATYDALLTALKQSGLPDVSRNSVVTVLTRALGLEPADRAEDFHKLFPQFPRLKAESKKAGAGCADVVVDATYLGPRRHRIKLVGTYCLVDPGLWRAKAQRVDRLE